MNSKSYKFFEDNLPDTMACGTSQHKKVKNCRKSVGFVGNFSEIFTKVKQSIALAESL